MTPTSEPFEPQRVSRKVLHATSTHRPDDVRIYQREVLSLNRAGADVSLYCCSPHANAAQNDGAAPIIRHERKRGLAARLVGSNISTVRHFVQERPEVIHVHEPELIVSLIAARLLGAIAVFDAHEDFAARARDRIGGVLGTVAGLGYSMVEKMMLFLANASVVTATESIAARYSGRDPIVLHNYPTSDEVDHIVTMSADSFDWSAYGHERPRQYVVYTGLLTEERGIGDIVAAASLQDLDWALVTAGPANPSFIETLRQRHPTSRWIHLGLLERDFALAITKGAVAGLIPFRDAHNHRNAMPNKLFEYQAAGIPSIATNFQLWNSLIADAGFGTTLDCEDIEMLAATIGDYCSDAVRRDSEGARAQLAATQNAAWEADFAKLVELYER